MKKIEDQNRVLKVIKYDDKKLKQGYGYLLIDETFQVFDTVKVSGYNPKCTGKFFIHDRSKAFHGLGELEPGIYQCTYTTGPDLYMIDHTGHSGPNDHWKCLTLIVAATENFGINLPILNVDEFTLTVKNTFIKDFEEELNKLKVVKETVSNHFINSDLPEEGIPFDDAIKVDIPKPTRLKKKKKPEPNVMSDKEMKEFFGINPAFRPGGRFVINTRKNGEFQFSLKASNGQVILTSEGYSSKAACLNGVASVMKNSQNEKNFVKLTAKNGKPYFNLKAANGQIIGNSEMYETEAGRDNGIVSVMKNAAVAGIIKDDY